MSKFKVGDRVRHFCGSNRRFSGKDGTVIVVDSDRLITIGYAIGIEFDEFIGGHSCKGIGKDGHCLWFYDSSSNYSINNLRFIENVTIDEHEMEKFL